MLSYAYDNMCFLPAWKIKSYFIFDRGQALAPAVITGRANLQNVISQACIICVKNLLQITYKNHYSTMYINT